MLLRVSNEKLGRGFGVRLAKSVQLLGAFICQGLEYIKKLSSSWNITEKIICSKKFQISAESDITPGY